MNNDLSLCILIPCHNEASSIFGVVSEFKTAFPKAEVLVVNNASTDDTQRLSIEAGARVLYEPRKGKANAINAGLDTIKTDLIIMVDGDGSYPAEGASRLLSKYLEQPVDLITGVRVPISNHPAVFRPMHRFGARLFAYGTGFVFGHRPGDIFSGLRLFSRRFYKNVPILSSGFELEMELTIQAADKGFSCSEVVVPFRERAGEGNSKLRTVRDGLKILRALLLLFRDYKPVYFFGSISLCFLILGLCAGSLPIYEYYETSMVGRFPLAILAAALVNISLFTLLTGMVAQTNLRYHREAFQIKLRNSEK